MQMTVQQDYNSGFLDFFVKHKLSNGQTLHMAFESETDFRKDEMPTYWVSLSVYSKRKTEWRADQYLRSTGTNPWESAIVGRRAFIALEEHVRDYHRRTGCRIVIHWEDNRRRDAYARALQPRGYYFGVYDGHKALIKVFNPDPELT